MLRPRVVLWWGIGVTVLGAAISIAGPAALFGFYGRANGVDNGLLFVLQTIVQLITGMVPIVGAALIAAGIVMAYLSRLLERAPEHTFRLGGEPRAQKPTPES